MLIIFSFFVMASCRASYALLKALRALLYCASAASKKGSSSGICSEGPALLAILGTGFFSFFFGGVSDFSEGSLFFCFGRVHFWDASDGETSLEEGVGGFFFFLSCFFYGGGDLGFCFILGAYLYPLGMPLCELSFIDYYSSSYSLFCCFLLGGGLSSSSLSFSDWF